MTEIGHVDDVAFVFQNDAGHWQANLYILGTKTEHWITSPEDESLTHGQTVSECIDKALKTWPGCQIVVESQCPPLPEAL